MFSPSTDVNNFRIVKPYSTEKQIYKLEQIKKWVTYLPSSFVFGLCFPIKIFFSKLNWVKTPFFPHLFQKDYVPHIYSIVRSICHSLNFDNLTVPNLACGYPFKLAPVFFLYILFFSKHFFTSWHHRKNVQGSYLTAYPSPIISYFFTLSWWY